MSAFQFSALSIWNSLPQTVLISDSLSIYKYRIKTSLFTQASTEHWSDLPSVPLWSYDRMVLYKFYYY